MGELLRITRSAVVFLMERHTRRDTILKKNEIFVRRVASGGSLKVMFDGKFYFYCEIMKNLQIDSIFFKNL